MSTITRIPCPVTYVPQNYNGAILEHIVNCSIHMKDISLMGYLKTIHDEHLLEQINPTDLTSVLIPLELICFNRPMRGSQEPLEAIAALGNKPATFKHHLLFGKTYPKLETTSSIVSLDTVLNKITDKMIEENEYLKSYFSLSGQEYEKMEKSGVVPLFTKDKDPFNEIPDRKITVCYLESDWQQDTFFLTVQN